MKPKTLNLREMWQLYKLLGKSQGQQYLLGEVIEMLKVVPPQNIKQSMVLMYGEMTSNPLELGTLFARGLRKNGFFEFQMVVEKLS